MLLVRSDSTTQRVDVHDVTFEPAGVTPSRVSLMTETEWFDRQLESLAATFQSAATQHWQRSFCREAPLGAEAAARCAHGGGALPAAAKDGLTIAFGPESDAVLGLPRAIRTTAK
jgi:hypothetical protein